MSGEDVDRAAEFAELIGSEEQQAALQDSVVTKDEYRSAIVNTLQCLDDGGLEVVDAGFGWSGIVYDYSVVGDESAGGLIDSCYRDQAEAVDMAWQLSVSPLREAIELEMSECLLGAGVQVPEGAPLHPNALRQVASEDIWDSCVIDARELDDAAEFLLAPLDWDE